MAVLSNLGRYKDAGLLILHVGLGAMMIFHGYPKIIGGPDGWAQLGASTKYVGITFLPTFWGLMAALAEGLGGVLILLGLWFRPAAIFLTLNMIVASAMHLGKGDGLMDASHAVELAFVFAGLIFIGPGKYSIDKR
ncbi:DoxX family protein [Mucilaginibacter sp. UR6-1]|uniref:DoxX family protein n=1 Tax=Mucilaginibacter sp. UR6-1 TaxID=1435643 RepID=UPI001E313941|nr:DoxX family protein [Mucilaginibacter sp. UR6-1]MCC8410892.1 DoxX family protein [Mucilaginibacter sp. UR6-1]